MNATLSSLSLLAITALVNVALVAEEPPRFAGPPRIATIDIDKVVRESREYQAKLTALRDAMEARTKNQARAEREELIHIADKAKTFAPGTAEYRAAEEALLNMTRCDLGGGDRNAKFRADADQARAQLFAVVHARVREEIAAYAREQQLQLVINRTPSKGTTTGVTIEKPAVWCRCFEGLSSNAPPSSRVIYSTCPDITATIVERLNAESP